MYPRDAPSAKKALLKGPFCVMPVSAVLSYRLRGKCTDRPELLYFFHKGTDGFRNFRRFIIMEVMAAGKRKEFAAQFFRIFLLERYPELTQILSI